MFLENKTNILWLWNKLSDKLEEEKNAWNKNKIQVIYDLLYKEVFTNQTSLCTQASITWLQK